MQQPPPAGGCLLGARSRFTLACNPATLASDSSMATVQLANLDARLVCLALQYHLARPGSELDPETKQPAAHGLAEVAQALEPQLQRAVATIELSDFQRGRLDSAIAGAMNELKTYPMLEAGRQSTVPGFVATLRRLFPQVAEDPDEATQLVAHLMALRRRLESLGVVASPEQVGAGPERRPWWRFWGRKGA